MDRYSGPVSRRCARPGTALKWRHFCVADRLLAIETSSEACSVAVRRGGETLERFEHAPMKHAERLLPAVRALLAEAEIGLGELDAIAFGRGPGRFTSLRIGIGVVQGLAWGAG